MNRKALILVVGCALTGAAGADRHPKAAEIQAYIDRNPIEPRLVEMTKGISRQSLSLNEQGYEAYEQKRYDAAIEKFREAMNADDRNSLPYYNAACSMALKYAALSDRDKPAMEMRILRYLKQAIERHWYWGLWMMADSDLDAVRRFSAGGDVEGLSITLRTDIEYGDLYNVLHRDGTFTNFTNREGGKELGRGYFCIIGSYVLRHMPLATTGPDSPPASHVNYVTRIDEFQPLRLGK